MIRSSLLFAALTLLPAVLAVPGFASAEEPPPEQPKAGPVKVSLQPQYVAPEPPPEPPEPQYRHPGMRMAGIVLTSMGIVTLTAGGVWGLTALTGENGAGFLGGVLLMMPLSTVIAAVGVPLWVVGAKPPLPQAATVVPSWALPSVAAGPRQVTLRWTF